MTDKFILIDRIKLFYTERNEKSPYYIFFFHGNTSSHQTWKKQLDSPILCGFHLIAFDLPAHGLSDGLPAGYTLPGIAKLMVKAVQQLSAEKPFILAGVSLGTNIIAEMMAHALRPAALLLAGPCIIGKDYTPDKFMIPDTKIGISFIDEPDEEDILTLIALAVNYPNEQQTNSIYKDFKVVKTGFRSDIGQSMVNGGYSDEIALIKQAQVPVLVIFGADDKAIHADYLDDVDMPYWKNKIIKLNGAGHWVHLDEPELFTDILAGFSDEVFNRVGS